MALSTLPYKWKITSRAGAGAGSIALGITVTDNAGVTRATFTIHVGATTTYNDLLNAIREHLGLAMITDAGSKVAMIDAMIAAGTLQDI